MSIHLFGQKIKGWVGEHRQILAYMAILVLTSLASFYLGYIAHMETSATSPVAIYCPLNAYIDPKSVANGSIDDMPNREGGAFVASRNGQNYYPASCAGVNRIKDENKVYFATSLDAQNAGYALAKACQ